MSKKEISFNGHESDNDSGRKGMDIAGERTKIEENNIGTSIEVTDQKQFTYLNITPEVKHFVFSPAEEDRNKIPVEISRLKDKFSLIIFLTVNDDTFDSSISLKLTLDSLFSNFPTLKEINISQKDILLVIWIKKINKKSNMNYLFPSSDDEGEEALAKGNFICNFASPFSSNNDGRSIKTLLITKYSMTNVEIRKSFYNIFLRSIISESQDQSLLTRYIINLSSGVIIPDRGIVNLMGVLYEEVAPDNYKKICAVPEFETIPEGLFARVQQYENVHYNIYDLYYMRVCAGIPVNSKCSLIKVNSKILENIKIFYSTKIYIDASISYHDVLLNSYLTELNYDTIYAPIVTCKTNQKQISYSDMMYNYSNKLQGNILGTYRMFLREFIRCPGQCNAQKKFISFFYLFGAIFNFTFPAWATMVIYAILYEGFDAIKGRACQFFTVIYCVILLIIGFASLIAKDPRKTNRLFFIIFIVIEAFYLMVLLTSVAAMHYIRINKRLDPYKFNTAAIVTIILFNFIFGIFPMIFNIKKVASNFVNMLIYVVVGCASYTSVFLIHAIFNASDSYGRNDILVVPRNPLTEKAEINVKKSSTIGHNEDSNSMPTQNESGGERKSFLISIWALSNALLSFFILLMDTRKSRVNCVLGLSIIFTVYNGIKMFSILYSKIGVVNEDVSKVETGENTRKVAMEISNVKTGTKSVNHKGIKGNEVGQSETYSINERNNGEEREENNDSREHSERVPSEYVQEDNNQRKEKYSNNNTNGENGENRESYTPY